MSGSSSNVEKPADIKAKMLSHWYQTGTGLIVEALSEITQLEAVIHSQRDEIARLNTELQQALDEATRLAQRNTLLVIEVMELKGGLGMGSGDEHAGGLE